MSRSLSGLQALALGAIVVVALGLGAAGVFSVGSRGWFGKDTLHVRSGFREIRGVEVGTRVRIQGIDAGEVEKIVPPDSPDGNVVLRLRIKGEFRHLVRGSSEVQILSEGMIGGKVVEIRPPRNKPGEPPPDMTLAVEDAMLPSAPSAELADAVSEFSSAIKGIQNGEGMLGGLVKDARGLVQTSKDTASRGGEAADAVGRGADALKKVPFLGGYIEDPVALLVRGNCERNRRVFGESELFEPGRAVLTANGREKLKELGPWLSGLKHSGSEIVVVSYADPAKKDEAKTAKNVTRQQSETVVEFLRKEHSAHKLGWFSSRRVVALGQGIQPPPAPEREALPPSRVEVIVFVPQ